MLLLCEWRTRGFDAGACVNRAWIEEGIFEEMRGVRNMRGEFVVEVNWMATEEFVLGNVPFELRRCVEKRQRGQGWKPDRHVDGAREQDGSASDGVGGVAQQEQQARDFLGSYSWNNAGRSLGGAQR